MAFDPNQLSALTYANGFTLWHYRTPDDFTRVCGAGAGAGYFAAASNLLRVGDKIIVNADIHGRVQSFDVFVVRNGDNRLVLRAATPVLAPMLEPSLEPVP
jgi:outer membrane protein assembly factor BamB